MRQAQIGRSQRREVLMRRRPILWMTLFVTLGACGKGGPTAPADPTSAATLRSAPTSIVAGGATLRLATELWRDFMPISPPDGKPMIAVAKVTTSNGSPVPTSVRATGIFIVLDDAVWSTSAREERPRSETAPVYEVVGRDGPKWGPGVSVDVILRITDGARVSFLRAANQAISATW
jgi:hypothetical protein